MAINFPTSLDTLSNPNTTDPQNSPSHAGQHADSNDAIEALEAKVGANSSAVTTSHDYKLSGVTASDKAASLAGTEELDNKTLDSAVAKGTWTGSSWQTPAFTAGGNITLAENASIDHDPSLSADGKYTGLCITGTAGAALAFGDLIYLDPTDSRWELADANIAAGSDGDPRGLLGICVLAAAADGDATKILLNGVVRADTAFPALTINAPVYVSETAGDIVVTQPTTADVVIRVLGFALTADAIYFNPSNDHITHT